MMQAGQKRLFAGRQERFAVAPEECPFASGLPSGGLAHKAKVLRAEKNLLRRRLRPKPSAWASRHIIVHEGPYPGRWRNEVAPYMPGIMNTFFFPSVQEVYVCKVPQSGGSECGNACLGYIIDHCPGTVMVCYPDEDTARTNSRDRIQPMIKSSPRLRRYMTGVADDMAETRINLQHMKIYFSWASSISRLANKPIRVAIGDEVDKYPERFKKEAGPINLLRKRLTAFRFNRKLLLISSPSVESGPIWTAMTREAEAFCVYEVRCPSCGYRHVMTEEHLRWERRQDGTHPDPAELERTEGAWYECPSCRDRWDDAKRDRAVLGGRWIVRGDGRPLDEYLVQARPRRIGFHVPAWISRFISLSECAAAKIRSLTDFDALKDYCNSVLAEPWKEVLFSAVSETLLAARTDLPPQTVPEDAVALTCGIDIHLNGFWYVVRAWARTMASWLVQFGFLATWDEVEALLFSAAWPVRGSDPQSYMPIASVAIDTGGGRKYSSASMTEEAYWKIRGYMGRGLHVYGVKGASRPLETRLRVGRPIDRTPSGKPIKGGLRLVTVDTAQMKDLVFSRLADAAAGGTQPAYLHQGTEKYYSNYFYQMMSEEKRRKEDGSTEWVQIRKDNHLLDCEVYCHAAADPSWPGGGVAVYAPGPAARLRASGSRPAARPRVRGMARSSYVSSGRHL